MRPSWIAPPACLVIVVLVVAGSGMGSRPLNAPASPSPAASDVALASATPEATPDPTSSAMATASPTAAPTLVQPGTADVAMAIAAQSSWIRYASTRYKFSIKHPTDWIVSQIQHPGWDSFLDRDGSNLVVTWRAIPKGTNPATITDEVWKVMHDNGYTVVGSKPGKITGRVAQILTVDGTASAGQQRHGTVGILVTPTGRYRIELWTRPGTDAENAALFNAFIGTFAIS